MGNNNSNSGIPRSNQISKKSKLRVYAVIRPAVLYASMDIHKTARKKARDLENEDFKKNSRRDER